MDTIDHRLGLRISAATNSLALTSGGLVAAAGLGIVIAKLLP